MLNCTDKIVGTIFFSRNGGYPSGSEVSLGFKFLHILRRTSGEKWM